MCNKNNRKRGFSLVEVLVAIAILALLAVPLAQTMISSSQINSKSKDVGVASDMGNTIIESMQSTLLGDVLTEVNGYTTDNVGNKLFNLETSEGYSFIHNALKGYNVTSTYEVMMICKQCRNRVSLSEKQAQLCEECGTALDNDNSVVYEPVRRQIDVGVTSDADVTSSIKTRTTKNGAVRTYFTGTEDDMYDFVLRDVYTDEASYDVLVHLEPEQTLALTNISSMSQSNVVNMVQKTGMEREVAEEFYQSHLIYATIHPEIATHNVVWFLNNMTRQTQIDVRKDAIRDAAVITVKSIYSVPDETVASSDKIITKVVGSFTTNSTSELAQGVYYYFYPLRNNGAVVRDKMSIKNPEGLALNIYFIAMDDGDDSTYTPQLLIENGDVSVLDICSNLENDTWSSLPEGLTIKSLGNISQEQTLYSMDVKVFTHKESNFEDNNAFVPNSKHMLVNTGATLLDSTEKFNVNVDSEILNPIPDDDDNSDEDDPIFDSGFSQAISKSFKYDGEEHSIREDNGKYVTWEGETEATDVGQYIAYAKPTENHTWPNGSTNKKQIVWYITPDNSATVEKVDAVYDGQEHTGVTGEHIILTGDVTRTDAGNYVVYAKPDSNHAWSDGTIATKTIGWQIKPRPITLTWEIGEGKDWWYYDGVEHHGNCIIGNIVPSDTCTPIYKDNSIKDLGAIKAIVTGLSNPNYELPKNETTHILEIKGAAVASVTMVPDVGTEVLIYNGHVQSGLESSSGVSISGQDTAIDAGEYVLTATPLPGYAWDNKGKDNAPRDFTWTIHQKVAKIEWGQTEWVYDGVEHSTTCTVTNADDSTPCKVIISDNHIIDAGTQPVTATLENINYKFPDNKIMHNTLVVTTANDAYYIVNEPVIYDERTHSWGTGKHIVVTGILETTEAGEYEVVIAPVKNYAWNDGTTTPVKAKWEIYHARMVSVSWADYNYTGSTIIGVKMCGARVGTCLKCDYTGEIPLVDYHGNPNKYMILHCPNPKCNNEDQSQFETSGFVDGSKYASFTKGQWKGITPGAYQVTVTPNKNYAWVDGSTDEKTITWNIFSNTAVKPDPVNPILTFTDPITVYEYNGTVRSPMISTMSGTLPLSDSHFTNNPYYTVTGTRSATDAGTYTATISLKDKATMLWQSGGNDDLIIKWKILPREITITTIPYLGERTYTDVRLFPASEKSITKQVAFEKDWDGRTFESKFNVPTSLTKDVDGDDITMTKDNIIDYHFDCLPDERETEPIANQQRIYFTITQETKEYSTAGVHEYAVTAIVKDSSGKNVTNNYKITYDYAWLMIHQVPILPSEITHPKANDLVYNGYYQNLVTAGSCPYGQLEYTIDGTANHSDTEDWTAYNGNNWSTLNGTNNTGWSKTIPRGLYAGDYKVYWRVDADQNHYDYTNHPNNDNIDKVAVTIRRATQEIKLSTNSITFCYNYISRSFTVRRYQDAILTFTTSGPIDISPSGKQCDSSGRKSTFSNGSSVTVSSLGTIQTCYVNIYANETANYQSASKTFTANIVDHKWVEKNVDSSNASQWPGCNNSDETHSRCWPWPDCTHNGIRHEICNYGCQAKRNVTLSPLSHKSVYGGTRDVHTKCSKCGGTLAGYSSHKFTKTVTAEATCTSAGTTHYKCACGYEFDKSDEPGKTGHNYYKRWYACSSTQHYKRCTYSECQHYLYGNHSYKTSKSGCCYKYNLCTLCNYPHETGHKDCAHNGTYKKTIRGEKVPYCSCCRKPI